jgi:hypothetical protein
MTFDKQKAQLDFDQWMKLDPRAPSTVIESGVILTEHMRAALDEINRQAKRIAELEEAYKLFVEANKKTIVFEKKRTDGILAALNMYEELEKKNIQQHAALKKLGQARRARGKALVEERAKKIEVPCRYDGSMTPCDYSGSNTGWRKDCDQKPRIRRLACEQLHQEGKL